MSDEKEKPATDTFRFFTHDKENTTVMLDGVVLFSGLEKADALALWFNEALLKYTKTKAWVDQKMEILKILKEVADAQKAEKEDDEGMEQ